MIGTGLPEATTLDVARAKWYIVSRYDRDVVPTLSGASEPRRRRRTSTVAHINVGSETCPYNSRTLTDGLKSPYTVIFGPFAVQGVHRRFLARSFRIHEPTTLCAD